MPIGQGWLNAWVKVNNKHVVYNRTDAELGQVPSTGSSTTRQPKTSRTTTTSAKTSSTAITENVETQAIRRVNSRKNRRRLHRTISASDLIRDQAKSLAGNIGGSSTLAVGTLTLPVIEHSAGSSSQVETSSPTASRNQIGDRSGIFYDTEESLRFVNELFGTDIDSLHRLEPPSTGDLEKGLWPWASHAQHVPADAASISSRNGISARPSGTSTIHTSYRSDTDENASIKGGFRFPPNLFSSDNSKARCDQCAKLENELAVLQDDLEYIRAVALRNEYVCSSCSAESLSHPTETPSTFHLKSNERLLDEVTARHKAQLEQLTKDRQRWQHDAHVKLQKYAALCKDLNEEATLRNEEVISLHKELDSLRLERDQMAGELEVARAVIANHERDALERKKLEERLQQYESRGLDEAEHAIKTRDFVIADLSHRLEKTMDVLELEREQQRQRRQIIFPIQRPPTSTDQGDLATELKNTKARLSDVQAELHALQRLTEHKEAEWISQISSFEEELNARCGDTLQRHRKLDIQS